MTKPSVLLWGYTEAQRNIWRFLLRQLPGIRLLPVGQGQLDLTIGQLLEQPEENLPAAPGQQRVAVFAGMEGPLLGRMIEISGQVPTDYRAAVTETNRNWTLPQLLEELKKEDALLRYGKKW